MTNEQSIPALVIELHVIQNQPYRIIMYNKLVNFAPVKCTLKISKHTHMRNFVRDLLIENFSLSFTDFDTQTTCAPRVIITIRDALVFNQG